jgi:hypothetical protein
MFRRQGVARTGMAPPEKTRSASEPSSLPRLRFQFVELPGVLGSLGKEPITEGYDFRQLGDCLRADDPIRIRCRHRNLEWAHESAADQVPCRKCRPRERDALAVHCRIDRHAGMVDNGAAGGVHAGNAGKVEPLAPALPIADVQERESAEIRGRAERVAAIEKLRTADRKQLLGAEARDVQSGRGSVAVANAKIDVLAREVDVMQGRADPEIDLGMSLGEPAQSMHEPLGCKIRRRGNRERAAALALQ